MEALCETGKITIEDGRIYQPRALKETKKAQENSEKQTKIAQARWSKSDAKDNENKPDSDAMALPRECQPEPEPEPELEVTTAKAVVAHTAIEQPNPQRGKGKVRGAARGARLSESWTPTLKDYAFAAKHNLTREEINREADKFRNHWTAATGKGSVKLDGEAAWRNWLIGDYGIVTKRAAAKPSVNGQNVGAFDRVVQRIHGALPGGEVTGHADFDSDDAGAIDGEYRIVPASEEPGADWQRGGSGEAAFGSLFAKGGS
jgi:hypothetical protein